MAIDTSKEFERKLKFPNLMGLRLRIALKRPIAKARARKRERLLANPPREARTICGVTDALEAGAAHFQEHGWAFIDPMLDPAFHADLVAHWPDRAFFDPPRSLKKGYDYGFHWVDGRANETRLTAANPEVQSFQNFMRSPEMAARMQAFTGWSHELYCNSVLATYSYTGTSVIPHRDTVAGSGAKPTANMIFFINGTGGARSGGLALSWDNELKDVFFEPMNLKNTCLIYDTSAPFYHGFEPIMRGKFRWMMSAHFTGLDQRVAAE
jgi:hypothetical protein